MERRPKRLREPWEQEYRDFLNTDHARHAHTDLALSDIQAKPSRNYPLNEETSVVMLDSTIHSMDHAVARKYGVATYDAIVGIAWQAFGQDMPLLSQRLLAIAGIRLDAHIPD